MASRMGRPNKINAGEDLVSGSIEFRYISKALWNLSTSRDPVAVMLSMSMRFTVLTASSALQLACGLATDEIPMSNPPGLQEFLCLPCCELGTSI